MSENIKGGKSNEEGEKGDGKCYFPCKSLFMRRPVRILIATAKKHCKKYGHMDGGSNECRPMVIRSIYIFIICLNIDCVCKILYCFNICYTYTNFA